MVGLGLYRLIASKLKDDISEKISSEANRARSVSLLHQGYTMWMIYTNGKNEYSKWRPCPSKHIFLEQAMGKTREALRDPARGLDWNDPVHRRIVYRLKINYVQYATENWVHWRYPGYSMPEGFDYQQDRNRKRALACSYIEELREDLRTDRQQTFDDKNRWSQFLLRSEPMLASGESNGTSAI